MIADHVLVPMFDTVPTTFTGEVDPFAARFPMLPDEDLDALAADIKANGLLHPLVLTPDGSLLDGRNRLAACERAGVQPDWVIYEGDRAAFVIGQNMQRRDLTQAQKAHLMTCSESEQTVRELAKVAGASASKIAEARVVRRFTPESSDAVIAGTLSHDAAYRAAKAIKDELAATAQQRAELEREAPDLLGMVHAEGWAAYLERTKKSREEAAAFREAVQRRNHAVTEAVYRLHLLGLDTGNVVQWFATYDKADTTHPLDSAQLRAAIHALTQLEKKL